MKSDSRSLDERSLILVTGGSGFFGGHLSDGVDVARFEEDFRRATASGIVNTSAQLGSAIGTAALLLTTAAVGQLPDSGGETPVIAWTVAAASAVAAAAAFARARPTGPPQVQP